MGIKLNKNAIKSPVYHEATHETNQKNIYLAGVICGGLQTNKWFIENSREHAVKIFDDLHKKLN
jgi:thioredoxin reductase